MTRLRWRHIYLCRQYVPELSRAICNSHFCDEQPLPSRQRCQQLSNPSWTQSKWAATPTPYARTGTTKDTILKYRMASQLRDKMESW
jgi:hypothetical protein